MRANIVVAIIMLTCVLLPFNNCGAYKTADDSLTGSGDDVELCAADLFETFETTYVPFFTANTCVSCHVSGGQAAHAPFAQPDTQEGYRVFIRRFGVDLAPDRVYNKLKAGHYGPPFTDLEADLIDFSKTWQQQLVQGSCFEYDFVSDKKALLKGSTPVFTELQVDSDGDLVPDTVVNIVQPSEQGYHKIQWQKVLASTTVTFEMEVQVNVNGSNAPKSYTARNLMVKSSSAPVRIKDFSLLLNDRSYYVTTYSKIDLLVSGNNVFQNVGSYSSGIYVKDSGELYGNTDKWSIKVKTIDETTP